MTPNKTRTPGGPGIFGMVVCVCVCVCERERERERESEKVSV